MLFELDEVPVLAVEVFLALDEKIFDDIIHSFGSLLPATG